jgi:electron transfer flavoprotein alpha subunit
MSKVLIVAEHLGGKLNAATAKCVSAAQALSPESIDILVLAADPASASPPKPRRSPAWPR